MHASEPCPCTWYFQLYSISLNPDPMTGWSKINAGTVQVVGYNSIHNDVFTVHLRIHEVPQTLNIRAGVQLQIPPGR